MQRTRVYVTGRPAVEHAAGLVSAEELGGRQAILLLVRLSWRVFEPVPREQLATLLWGERRPASWETGLTTAVSSLRGTLASTPVRIEGNAGAYTVVAPSGLWVDVVAARDAVHRMEGAVRAGRMEDAYGWSSVVTTIARRPLLPGHDGDWVERARDELRAMRVRGLDAAVRVAVWNSEPGAAIAYARTLVELDPLREPSHRRLMEAHVAAGDRASALRVYERCRRQLAEELGVDPAAATVAAYERILRG